MIDLAIKHLIKEEDLKLIPYTCSGGWWTIGVGHLIDSRKGGRLPPGVHSFPISEQQARQILGDDIHKVHTDLVMNLSYWSSLSKVRQVCLISMAFQMGVEGLMDFKNTLKMVEEGNYVGAATNMLRSKWSRQTSERANRIANAMATDREGYLV